MRRNLNRATLPWGLVGLTVLAQISYPLVHDSARDAVTIVTVCLGFAAAVAHAAVSRGPRVAAVLVLVTAGGGLLVEAVGTATGVPFGAYTYADSLGARIVGVPWVVPLAWTMMAWPAWVVAGRLVSRRVPRVAVAACALAAWDVFLDPQMVAAGHWTWAPTGIPGLPGIPDIPVTNYVGWLAVGVAMATVLALTDRAAPPLAGSLSRAGTPKSEPTRAATPVAGSLSGLRAPDSEPGGRREGDGPVVVFYLWTYASSVLAHAAFWGLPASAAWGGLAMGVVAVPLAVRVLRRYRPTVGPRRVAAG